MECEFCGNQLYETVKEKQATCITCLAEHKWENGHYVPAWRNHHTVCQVIRDIHSLTTDSGVKAKCALAIRMTKRLHDKFKTYRDSNEELKRELLELKMRVTHAWGE